MGEILGSALGIALTIIIIAFYRKIKYNIDAKRTTGKLNNIKASLNSEDPNVLLNKLFEILYKDPLNYEAHYIRGTLLMKTLNYDKAIISLNKCLEINKDDELNKKVKLKRGECYFYENNYKLALEDFEEVIELADVNKQNMYKECLNKYDSKTSDDRVEM